MADEPLKNGQRTEKLSALLNELKEKSKELGISEKRAKDIVRSADRVTRERIGDDASVNVIDPDEIKTILSKIYSEGIAGPTAAELLKVTNHIAQQRHKHEATLRFFKRYINPEDYATLGQAYQYVQLVEDVSTRNPQKGRMIRGLLILIEKNTKYGRRILFQVSTGWINRTRRHMMDKVKSLTKEHWVTGPEAEAVKQVFYNALIPDEFTVTVRSSDEPEDVFVQIADRFVPRDPMQRRKAAKQIQIYSAGHARSVAREAVRLFLDTYPFFEASEETDPDSPQCSIIHIKREDLAEPSPSTSCQGPTKH